MPVSMSMVCDFEAWAACDLSAPFSSDVICSNEPPSRLRANWILVSLVSRLMTALRICLSDMLIMCVMVIVFPSCWNHFGSGEMTSIFPEADGQHGDAGLIR